MSCASLHRPQPAERTWWACALLIGIVPYAVGQNSDAVPTLLFEPVVIEVLDADAAATFTVRELTALPRADSTVDLQDWLAQRNLAPTLPAEELAADIAAYEQAVLNRESAGGAFDPGLDEELLAMGTLLQQAGDLARAQQVLDRALHVNRLNDGLFNMGQVPIIERTIENHLARGDLVAADEQHEYLLFVQRKNFADRSVDLLPALTRYAEWSLFAFGARLVPLVTASADGAVDAEVDAPPRDNSDSMISFRAGRLIAAQQVYQSIIAIVANNFGLGDNRLENLERQLALTNYLYIATFGLESGQWDPSVMTTYNTFMPAFDTRETKRPPLGFRQGRDALERRVDYLEGKSSTPIQETAQAKLDLADWMLMFSKRMGSLDIYLEAWQDMVSAGIPAEELNALFNPPFPTSIPAYLEQPYTRQALGIPGDLALAYKGYIDVEFRLSRFGETGAMKVINKSPDAAPALESILLRNLRRSQFRPRIVDGMVRENETMQVRFYFTY